MNKLQEAILAFRNMMGSVYGNNVNNQKQFYQSVMGMSPVSPLPDTVPQQMGNDVRNIAQTIPPVMKSSLGSAIELTPPAQLAKRLDTSKRYQPYRQGKGINLVPYQEQLNQVQSDLDNASNATVLAGTALMRPFMRNPMELLTGQQAIREGNVWFIQNR